MTKLGDEPQIHTGFWGRSTDDFWVTDDTDFGPAEVDGLGPFHRIPAAKSAWHTHTGNCKSAPDVFSLTKLAAVVDETRGSNQSYCNMRMLYLAGRLYAL